MNKSHKPMKKKRPQQRLKPARGAGSINAKADALQLCRMGYRELAADVANEHRNITGRALFPRLVVEAWRAAV